jgi:Na+/H+ antiporter NhaC
MNPLKKIAGINMIILLVLTIISGLTVLGENGQYKGLGAMILMAIGIGLQAGILFLVSLIKFGTKKKEDGRAYLLSSLLVLVVGFSACFGLGSLF